MSISQKIKILCAHIDISVAELARRIGQSPQNFNAKMKREGFSVSELEQIALAVDCKYENYFVLSNGDKI